MLTHAKTFFLLQKTIFPFLIFTADIAFLKSNIDEFDSLNILKIQRESEREKEREI